jgi:hypothetical protein
MLAQTPTLASIFQIKSVTTIEPWLATSTELQRATVELCPLHLQPFGAMSRDDAH